METLTYPDTNATMASPPGLSSDECMARHTMDCLAQRLAELESKLHGYFPAVAADIGLDAARDAGLRHIEQVHGGKACDVTNGAAWLLRIAMRAAIRYMKRLPRHVSIDIAMLVMQTQGAFDAQGDLTAVRDAFEKLPARQKEAVFLRVTVGLSLREAAREMSIAPQTVQSYLDKAYSRLRESLNVIGNNNYSAGAFAS